MAITDRITYDSITLLEDGQLQVRRSRVILDNDGVTEVARTHFRTVLVPGQDVSMYPARVRALCEFVWTPQVIAAFLAAQEARVP
jgi:hypothetical protein